MAMSSKELAAMLGVSPSAVSIALNGRDGISEEKRARILQAAEAYGLRHTPHKNSKSAFLNLVIYKRHGQVYGDTPFFSAVIEGISQKAAETGHHLQITYFYGNQDPEEQLRTLALSDCAGILLLATEMTGADILPFRKLTKPLVVLDSYFEDAPFDSVLINNQQGAFLAARYLIEAGHTDLGYLHSNVEINNFSERSDGFLKAVRSAEPPCTYRVIRVGSTQESAYKDMVRYLGSSPSLPTAFFADNDIIAISCMRALKEYGCRIPDDVSIIGFDNLPMSYVTSPKLTTVDVPKEVLGRLATSALIRQIQEPGQFTTKLCANTSLVIRDTVRTVPRAE